MRRVASILAVCVGLAAVLCPPAAAQTQRPIVILISIDGWRFDYLDRFDAPNLRGLASRGVRAAGLIPVFPSKTYPNHYTIVTGLYPEHHGVVANNIADPDFPERFGMDTPTKRDSRWWGGEPVWVTAIREGRLAAPMFWPGSEASISGVRPTYWKPFDDGVSTSARVAQVLDWLALPEGQRPSFVTLYFSDVDHAGHDFGPSSPEVAAAARRVDDAIGQLLSGVRMFGLEGRTSVIVVSDHGMSAQSDERTIFLDDYIDLASVDVIDWSPVLSILPRSGSAERLYRALRNRHPHLKMYMRETTPAHLHYRANRRIAPVVGLADDGWRVTSHERQASARATNKVEAGDHGYDPRYRSMRGLFVAAGPRLRRGVVVPAFENVHLYDLLCELLEVSPAPNDGDPSVTRSFLTTVRARSW